MKYKALALVLFVVTMLSPWRAWPGSVNEPSFEGLYSNHQEGKSVSRSSIEQAVASHEYGEIGQGIIVLAVVSFLLMRKRLT